MSLSHLKKKRKIIRLLPKEGVLSLIVYETAALSIGAFE